MLRAPLGWYVGVPFTLLIIFVLTPRLAVLARYAVKGERVPFWRQYWLTASTCAGVLCASVLLAWELISPYHVPGIVAPSTSPILERPAGHVTCEIRVAGVCQPVIHAHWQTPTPTH